jgi:hypothetical protein
MLLLDGSASIEHSAWLKILQFTANIGLNFTTGHDFMKYGIVQFSGQADVFMPLLADNATFMSTVQMIPQFEESTNTSGGVAVVEQEFKKNARPGAFKVMVILTDGMWNTGGSPLNITARMKKEGIHIFTVAVGDANNANVKSLASLPLSKYFYNVTTENELPLILHKMIYHMCDRDNMDNEEIIETRIDSTITSHDDGSAHIKPKSRRNSVDENGAEVAVKVISGNYNSASFFATDANASMFNDCGSNGPGRVLEIVNKGLNVMRIHTCYLDYNKEVCKGSASSGPQMYHSCPLFVPANATVALRVDANVTYVVAIYCVDNPKSIHCLSSPTALEFYGPNPEGGSFPPQLLIPASSKQFCEKDLDCPNSTCNTTAASPPYTCN